MIFHTMESFQLFRERSSLFQQDNAGMHQTKLTDVHKALTGTMSVEAVSFLFFIL